MEKTEKKDKEIEGDNTKEREHMWNIGKIVNKRVEGPYMEWVIDMEPRGSKVLFSLINFSNFKY